MADPTQQLPTWASSAVSIATSLWQAFVVPLGLAAFGLMKWRRANQLTAEERQEAENRRLMDRADGEMAKALARVEADNAALRAQLKEAQADVRRLEAVAQAEVRRAGLVWHAWANLVQAQNGALVRANLPPLPDTQWPVHPGVGGDRA